MRAIMGLALLVLLVPLIRLSGADAGTIGDGLRQAIQATALVRAVGQTEGGSGSAFVIQRTPSRLVLATNWHVIKPAMQGAIGAVQVVFASGTPREIAMPAVVLGGSPGRDLALIACDGFPQAPAALPVPTTAVTIAPGDPLVTIGFPLGDLLSAKILGHPETTISQAVAGPVLRNPHGQPVGIALVSGINPGNSGGPLVTPQGRLVGVNTGGAIEQRLGLAVPAQELLALQNGDAIAMAVTTDPGNPQQLLVQARITDPFAKVEQASMLLVPDTPQVAAPRADGQGRIGPLGGAPRSVRLQRSTDDPQHWSGILRLDPRDAAVDVWIAQVRHGSASLGHGSILQRWRVRAGVDQHHDWQPGQPPWVRPVHLPLQTDAVVWSPHAQVDPTWIIQRRMALDGAGKLVQDPVLIALLLAQQRGDSLTRAATGSLTEAASLPTPQSFSDSLVQVTATTTTDTILTGLGTVIGELSPGTPLVVTSQVLANTNADEPKWSIAVGGVSAAARIAARDPTSGILVLAVPQPPTDLRALPIRDQAPRATEPVRLLTAPDRGIDSTITAIRRDDVGQIQLLQISGVFDRSAIGAPVVADDGLVGLLVARGAKIAAGIDLLLPASTITDLLAGAPTTIQLEAVSPAEGRAQIGITVDLVDLHQRISGVEALVAPFVDESSLPKTDSRGRLGKLPGRTQRIVLRRTGDQATGSIDVTMAGMVYAPWMVQIRTASNGTMRSWSPLLIRVPFNGFARYSASNLPPP